ncbi:MAG: class I SAM-dependent methyltransferase [Planctomycetes bacterium]|nr:class I SAM-dependent methyltransferase [Planctomycetota bacterium]
MHFDAAPFRSIDAWVDRHPTRTSRGWHRDDLVPYDPAIQQIRSELFEFLQLAMQRGCRHSVQIGLGMHGGTHFAFRRCFESVTTVEYDQNLIDRYQAHDPDLDAGDRFVTGCSWDGDTVARVAAFPEPVDLLFIDGGHRFDEVKADWLAYKHLVRPGGIIAFHDSVRRCKPVDVAVDRFLAWLEQEYGIVVTHIGTTLGIGYYVQPDLAPPLAAVEHRGGFTILSDEELGTWWAVPGTTAPVRRRDIEDGDFPVHLAAADRRGIDRAVAVVCAARQEVERVCALLAAGDLDGLRRQIERVHLDHPQVAAVLDDALVRGRNSTDLLAWSGAMSLAASAAAIDLLQRASRRDPCNEQKLLMLARALAAGATGPAEPTTLIPTLRDLVLKLRDPAASLVFAGD